MIRNTTVFTIVSFSLEILLVLHSEQGALLYEIYNTNVKFEDTKLLHLFCNIYIMANKQYWVLRQ